MFARLAIATVLGVFVTLGVLLLMQTLIATANRELNESGSRHFVDFVRVERSETIERKSRKQEKPPEPQAPPPDSPQPQVEDTEPGKMAINMAAVPVDVDMSMDGMGLVASDGDFLPLNKITPVYPIRAQRQGIEGYCIVQYTVTRAGTTRDLVLVEEKPKGFFAKSALAVAKKYKYKPRIVNGEPVEVPGVRTKITFKFDE